MKRMPLACLIVVATLSVGQYWGRTAGSVWAGSAQASQTLLTVSGTGSPSKYKSKTFATSGAWQAQWLFDCSRASSADFHIAVFKPNGKRAGGPDVHSKNRAGHGMQRHKHGGSFYLLIHSPCTWSVTVVGAKPGTPATPTALPTSTPRPTATPRPTPTQVPAPTLRPESLAVPLSVFPAGSTLVANQVYTNAQADAQPLLLHFGTLSRDLQGRMTGYGMETRQAHVDSSGTPHPTLIYYLASIFKTHEQAVAAFTQQRGGWQYAGDAGECPEGVYGDSTACAYVGDNSQGATTEIFFTRGRVLVQVWSLDQSADFFSADRTIATATAQAQRQVAIRLDQVAAAQQGAGSAT